MQIVFIGYEIKITYDDYNIHESIVQNLNEIDSICLNLINNDDYFNIEFSKKYRLNDGNFVYSKKEYYQVDNKNIPQRELYIRKFNEISQVIYTSSDVQDSDLIECSNILNSILTIDDIKVSELTLLASFRYALGRRTYIVSEVIDNILLNWDNLSEKLKLNVKEEIQEAIKNNNFGDQLDLQRWSKISEK